jgi:hypothetical protein
MAYFETFDTGDKVSLTKHGSWQVTGRTRKALRATGVVIGRCDDYPQRRLYKVVLDDPALNDLCPMKEKVWFFTCADIDHAGAESRAMEFQIGRKAYVAKPEATLFHGQRFEVTHVNGDMVYIDWYGGSFAFQSGYLSRRRPKAVA